MAVYLLMGYWPVALGLGLPLRLPVVVVLGTVPYSRNDGHVSKCLSSEYSRGQPLWHWSVPVTVALPATEVLVPALQVLACLNT